MKLSLKKIFSIVIAGLAFLLFINTFLPFCSWEYYTSEWENLWGYSVSYSVFTLLCVLGIIAVYVLNILGILKEKWVNYVNYPIGFISLFHISALFYMLGSDIWNSHVGTWFGAILSLAILALSVVRNFMSDEALNVGGNKAPIKGYDPKTGKPIYAKQKGFDPKTGKPIYED